MGEDYIPKAQGTKQQKYLNVLEGIEERFDKNNLPLSNISNLIALLKIQFGWWWVGFYFVFKNVLCLGPFQGPPACTRIYPKSGVCGKSWQIAQTVIVQDVNKFQGHIACSSVSKSQIVVPIIIDGKVVGVLDVDSQKFSNFDEFDKKYLQKIIIEFVNQGQFKWLNQI